VKQTRQQHWDYTATALGLHGNSNGITRQQHWDNTATALGLHGNSTGITQQQHWDYTATAMGLHRNVSLSLSRDHSSLHLISFHNKRFKKMYSPGLSALLQRLIEIW
jgi:hypothetical protein